MYSKMYVLSSPHQPQWVNSVQILTTGYGPDTPMTSQSSEYTQVPITAPQNMRQKTNLTHLPTSQKYLGGVKDKDFTMTIGFPGSTDRYLSSWGVESRIKDQNEPRILVRGIKQDIWMKHMLEDQAVRIQYASKYAGSSNYWKNSIGMNKGLRKLNVVDNKRAIEKEFAQWVAADPTRTAKYGTALDDLRNAIEAEGTLLYNYTILSEALSGTELRALTAMPNEDITQFNADALYKDFSPIVARATLPAMLKVVKEHVAPEYLPSIFNKIAEEFNGDFEKYADYLFKHSVVVTKERIVKALENYDALKAAHDSDPAVELVDSFRNVLITLSDQLYKTAGQHERGRRLFFTGLQEMTPNEHLPSDANFTKRLSYGSVGGYKPYDGAWYNYFTTEEGIFQKKTPQATSLQYSQKSSRCFALKISDNMQTKMAHYTSTSSPTTISPAVTLVAQSSMLTET